MLCCFTVIQIDMFFLLFERNEMEIEIWVPQVYQLKCFNVIHLQILIVAYFLNHNR